MDIAYNGLNRRDKRPINGPERKRSENVKEAIVVAREYKNIKLLSEEVAELDYKPGKCKRACRMVVVRKNLSVERGENVLFEGARDCFYLTNDRESQRERVVFEATVFATRRTS